MFRRLAASLMLWMGVLALAAPVLACGSSMAPTKDCCPEGEPSPCKEGSTPAGIVTCCAAAPVSSTAAAFEAPRTQQEQPFNERSADPIILAAGFHAFSSPQQNELIATWAEDPAQPRDASLTWLHTGRLRL